MNKMQLSIATRNKLLDAAVKVILEAGPAAMTLETVARHAGVSKGGLLYHFPTKVSLIEGMVVRLIDAIDDLIAEEMKKPGANYLTATIQASFRQIPGSDNLFNGLSAAIANNPALLEPVQERYRTWQGKIDDAVQSKETGMLIRLTLDGLWACDLFGFAPPTPDMREKVRNILLEMAK